LPFWKHPKGGRLGTRQQEIPGYFIINLEISGTCEVAKMLEV
jgi:hypothetical protein